MDQPQYFGNVDACIDTLLSVVGKRIVLGIPLGTGKPNRFVNALYERACDDETLHLTIFTALTPFAPRGQSLLEQRLLAPIAERLYGDYEPLAYAEAVRKDALPPNIDVAEFYFAPASHLSAKYAQRQHVSANYSHVTQLLLDRGVNVVAQSIARKESDSGPRFSLGSNPDLILDLVQQSESGRRPYLIGQITDSMPFMPNDAETAPAFWNAIVDEQGCRESAALFALPNEPVRLKDYAIATHVTSMIEDGGTLQIGIGSLADAVTHVIRLRHTRNETYRDLTQRLVGASEQSLRTALPVARGRFEQGLYGASEMLVEGLLHLIDAGVLKRSVAARHERDQSVVLHAAFFLGSADFYARLHALSEAERAAIEMTGVRFVNTLDDEFASKCAQRRRARFVNSAMMVTLDGAIVSDGLEDKRVVSGVGGQHDFVAMAQRLPGARSIIVLPSTRTKAGRAQSNIVFDYAHITVPRQFRDVVVTEYGAVDLRGASDRDVMVRLLNIADSRFQSSLLAKAQSAGKIEPGYRIPEAFRSNSPARLAQALSGDLRQHLPLFPLSSDFSAEEARAAVALGHLKTLAGSKSRLAHLMLTVPTDPEAVRGVLERMGLDRPRGIEERISRRLLMAALAATEDDRPLFDS